MAGLLYEDATHVFTDMEYEKFKECFTFFDRNGDNTMSTEDVGLALRSMGALVSDKEVKMLVLKYDLDRTGKIRLDDYISMLGEVLNKPDEVETIQNAFSSFDKADSGLLSIEEMKYVMTRIGDTISPEEATNFFNVLDIHGDGYARME